MRTTFGALALVLVLAGCGTPDPLEEQGLTLAPASTTTAVPLDLADADFYMASLTGATLQGANLTNANLTLADLTGANL